MDQRKRDGRLLRQPRASPRLPATSRRLWSGNSLGRRIGPPDRPPQGGLDGARSPTAPPNDAWQSIDVQRTTGPRDSASRVLRQRQRSRKSLRVGACEGLCRSMDARNERYGRAGSATGWIMPRPAQASSRRANVPREGARPTRLREGSWLAPSSDHDCGGAPDRPPACDRHGPSGDRDRDYSRDRLARPRDCGRRRYPFLRLGRGRWNILGDRRAFWDHRLRLSRYL